MAGANYVRSRVLGLERLQDRMVTGPTERASRAAKSTIEATGRKVLTAVRQDIDRIMTGSAQRGQHRQVSNAVRLKIFRIERNGRFGWRAQIYSKFGSGRGADFEDYFAPFITGRDVRPKAGGMLYIPLTGTRRARRKVRGVVGLDKSLDFVPIGKGRYLLIKRTQKRKSAGKQIGTAVALLVPVVKIKRRLRARELALQEARSMGVSMRQYWARERL